jgi:hypothetical protein
VADQQDPAAALVVGEVPRQSGHQHVAELGFIALGDMGNAFDRPPALLEPSLHQVGHLVDPIDAEGPAVDADGRSKVVQIGVAATFDQPFELVDVDRTGRRHSLAAS